MVEVSTSSLIGVAIACGGNVLISLALTVQKLAHRRQTEELVAAHSASASEASSPGASSPRMETPTGDSTAVATPTQNAAIPVLVQLDTGDSTNEQDGVLHHLTGEATSSDAELGQRRTRGNTDKKGSEAQTISLTNVGPSEVSLSSPTGTRQRSDDKKSSHDEGSGTGRDGGAGGDGKPEVEEGQYLKSKLWWLGLSLIAIGEGGNFLSYGFAPASVVAPLGTVALIANCIFAPVILKERFHAKELFGMGLAILGAVVVVWSSKASNPRLDPYGLQKAIIQIPFIVYTAINLVFIIILLLLSRSPRFGPKYIGIDVGVCALFGGYTVLSTKALSSLLSTIFLNVLEYWITWLLIVVLVVTSVLQVKYLNRALMRFQSKEVIPTQFVFFSLAAIIGSAVLYQEFRDVSISQFVNFAFGIATTFFGVHLLTSFSSSEEEEDDEEEGSPSNTRPDGPQRVLSSASLNLLLPSTSRMSYTERSPLLISATSDSGVAYRPAVAVLGRSPIGSVPMTASTTGSAGGGAGGGQVVKARLIKRSSTSDFSPLGLGSQAGFLLLATTPPTSAGGVGSGAMRRDRSASRSQVGPHGQAPGQVGAIPEVRDEERQASGGV